MSFSTMAPKRRTVNTARPPKKRRRVDSKIEEITFDLKEREDYLSGFHKRKLQRQKLAQAEAVKRERQEKLAARKVLRESRKEDLRKHVEAVNAVMRNEDATQSDNSEGNHDDETEVEGDLEDESIPLDHEEEYVDEDKFTTVTVETVELSRDGLKMVFDDTEDQDESTQKPKVPTARILANEKQKWMDGGPNKAKPKPRKKRFKYENKADRKLTRFKERGKGKRQAKERREK